MQTPTRKCRLWSRPTTRTRTMRNWEMGRQAKKTRGGYVSYPLETSMHAAAKKQQATSRSPPALKVLVLCQLHQLPYSILLRSRKMSVRGGRLMPQRRQYFHGCHVRVQRIYQQGTFWTNVRFLELGPRPSTQSSSHWKVWANIWLENVYIWEPSPAGNTIPFTASLQIVIIAVCRSRIILGSVS